jgi:hypothetical protein
MNEDLKNFLKDVASEFRGNPVGAHRVKKASDLLKKLDAVNKRSANYWYLKGVLDAETTKRQDIPLDETIKDFETHFELVYSTQTTK